MEPLARVTLLGVLSRGAYIFPLAKGDGSFAVWNGSRAELPLVDTTGREDEGDGREGRVKGVAPMLWTRSSRGSGTSEEDGRVGGGEVLQGEAYTAVMLLQTLVVLGVIGFLGVRKVGEEDKRHFESWNM